MNLLYLAYRNILRHKRRTIFTGVTVMVGVLLYSFLDSINSGLAEESYRNVQEFETGFFEATKDSYFKDRDEYPLDEAFDPSSVIAAIPSRQKYTTRSYFKTEANVYENPYPHDGSFNLVGVVVDPKTDKDVFETSKYMFDGKFISEDSPKDSVVIGSLLADKIGAKVGYPITFSMRTKEGTEQTVDAVIIGIFSTPAAKLNGKFAYFSKDLMDDGLEMNGEVSAVHFKLGQFGAEKDYEKLLQRLKPHFPEGVAAYKWSDVVSDLVLFVKFRQIASLFVVALIFIITFVGIANTMLMSVNERSFEIGALMSLGMRRRELVTLFSYEGMLIGIVGALAGFLLGLVLNYWAVNYGFKIDDIKEGKIDIPFRTSGNLRGTWHLSGMLFAVFMAIFVATLSSFFATYRFTKKKIVSCLRGSDE